MPLKMSVMQDVIAVSLNQVVGSPYCIESDAGQKVFDRIAIALEADRLVHVSFRNVSALTATFLNTAIGQLYGKFDVTTIRSKIKIIDIDQGDLELLKAVVDGAKLYFKNREKNLQIIKGNLEGEYEDQ